MYISGFPVFFASKKIKIVDHTPVHWHAQTMARLVRNAACLGLLAVAVADKSLQDRALALVGSESWAAGNICC